MRFAGRQFPVVPLGITVGLFAADGVLASGDVVAGRSKYLGGGPTAKMGHATMLQAGAAALGLAGEFFLNWPTDISDPILFYAAGSVARELAFKTAQGAAVGTSYPTAAVAQGYRAYARPLAAPSVGAFNSWGDTYPQGRIA